MGSKCEFKNSNGGSKKHRRGFFVLTNSLSPPSIEFPDPYHPCESITDTRTCTTHCS